MRPSRLAWSVLAFLFAFVPSLIGAQARPTPAQAEALLRSRPELVQQLRDRIAASGMTPEQIRARLRAEGYPENLLDPYLDPGIPSATARVDNRLASAVRALSLADSVDLDRIRMLAGSLPDTPMPARAEPRRQRVDETDPTLAPESAEIFGLDLFSEASTLFVPVLDGPVDASYRLGPGDELVLILTGEVEAAYMLDVTREGFIVVPLVGQLNVRGLTLAQLEDLLYARLPRVHSGVRRGSGATTHFSVSLARLRAIQVFVTGDVVRPGAQRVSAVSTALTALYAAGGPTENGSMRRIQVRRGTEIAGEVDLYDYLLRGDASRDVRLEQGDVIFVPVHGPRARIDGEVTRPARYEVRPGESLRTVLTAAGGLRARAGGRRVLIERIVPHGERAPGGADRVVIDVPLGDGGLAPAMSIADGDVIRVPGIADRVRDRVMVQGHVWSPGVQGYNADLTLEEALRRAGGVKPDAYLGRVLVSRLRPDSTRIQLRAALRDSTGATFEPFPLERDDQVTVFSRTEFRPEQFVAIGGAVQSGGRFPWREGMTLRDLVLKAGGLDQSAYLSEAEIARLPSVPSPMATAQTIRVPIDSSYRFDLIGSATPPAGDIPLRPFDNVLILRDPNWHIPTSVLLTGEVRFPGRYTLRARNERLSDVIGHAGGLTELADPNGMYFSRVISRSTERIGLDSLTARADSSRLAGMDNRIRLGVDLAQALRRRSGSDDMLLVDGDSIHVPVRQQTVEVRGEVNAPTALTHRARRGLGFYVDAAGGPTQTALHRHAYVIQPNGKVESRRHFLYLFKIDPTPMPGATVVVPAKDPTRQPTNVAATVGIFAQVLASVVTIVVLTR